MTGGEITLARKSLAMLDRQWRMKSGWTIRDNDYEEIGALTEEQLKLPRHLVHQLIRTRRTDNYIERMHLTGREVLYCLKCR